MLQEIDIINFLSVKCGCTIDEFVGYINTVYSHFGGVIFSKEEVESLLVEICKTGYPFYLEKLVNSDIIENQIWGIFRSNIPINQRFSYGG